MVQVLPISSRTMAKAVRLGDEIAETDKAIRPRLQDVARYSSYRQFRQVHRAYWEHTTHFEEHWQERVFCLGEKEAKRHGLSEYDSAEHWEVWYYQIVWPIQAVVWEQWERRWRLEHLYNQALAHATDIPALAPEAMITPIGRDGRSMEQRIQPRRPARMGLLGFLFGRPRGAYPNA